VTRSTQPRQTRLKSAEVWGVPGTGQFLFSGPYAPDSYGGVRRVGSSITYKLHVVNLKVF